MARYADAESVPKVEASRDEVEEPKTTIVTEFEYLQLLLEQKLNILEAKVDKILLLLEK